MRIAIVQFAEGLRRRGIDVTTTPQVGLLSASDEAHALNHNRVIFTQDRDFLRLHAAGTPHAGIAYCDKNSRGVGRIIKHLVLVWEILEPDEMRGNVEYL
jgi:hypothetical protein